MSIASTSPPQTAHEVGALVIGGDWASAHGDLSTLHHIALQLAERAPAPLKGPLRAFAAACYADPQRAAEQWATLRTRCFDPH